MSAPQLKILEMMMGSWVSEVVVACAELQVVDALAGGAVRYDDIARACDADADAMHRLLRAAATIGLLEQDDRGAFRATALGDCLAVNAPGSLRNHVLARMASCHRLPWTLLSRAIRTGASVANDALGMNVWQHYARHPEESALFSQSMNDLSAIVAADLYRQDVVARSRFMVDVGGGHGVLLRALLAGNEQARGVVLERPEIVGEALRANDDGFDRRLEFVGGDFFVDVPAGGDLYILKCVLHDWSDDDCLRILRRVHSAASADATLLVIEMLLPERSSSPSLATLMDLNMLVLVGGRERSLSAMTDLLLGGGFAVRQHFPISCMLNVVESRRL